LFNTDHDFNRNLHNSKQINYFAKKMNDCWRIRDPNNPTVDNKLIITYH